MNQIIEAMIERRSCRSYKPEQIKKEELDLILKAGEWAASGQGAQSAVMVAVQDPKLVKRLSELNASVMGTETDPFYGAPMVVAVLADSKRNTYIEDGALVIGNMMLAASSIGVASCWIHRAKEVFNGEEGRALARSWGLGDDYVGVGHCILGYAAGELPAPKERKPGRIIMG